MKVFVFDYDCDFGGGMMYIAAPNERAAEEVAKEVPTGFGIWRLSHEESRLSANVDKPQVITNYSWAE